MASYSYAALEVLVEANTRKAAAQIEKDMTGAGQKAGAAASEHMAKGLGRVAPVAASVGKAAVAGFGLATAAAVAFGVKAYKAAEQANVAIAQTNAVIKSTGGAANVTAAQVGKLASSIMLQTGITRGSIRAGENMLLTFRNIRNEQGKGNDVFNRATRAATDMTAAMHGGEVTGDTLRKTSIQLGKALNDPVKGLTSLSRVGVQFTDGQKKQITALVASGHQLQAQKIILAELNKEFGGSAASAATAGKRFHAAFAAVQSSIGQVVLKAVDPAVESFAKLAGQFASGASDGGKLTPIFNAISGALTQIISPLTHVIDLFAGWLGKLTPQQINQVADAIKRFGPALAAAGAAAAIFTGAGLGESLPVIGPMLGKLLGPLNMVKTQMLSVGKAAAYQLIPSLTGSMGEVEGLGAKLGGLAGPFALAAGGFALLMAVSPQFRQAVMDIAQALLKALTPALTELVGAFTLMIPPITEVAKVVGGALAVALEAVVPLITLLGQVLKLIAPILPPLVVAWLAYRTALMLSAAAQWALNIAMEANPIGLVIVGLVALGAALYLAWTKSETFRAVLTAAWKAILGAAMAVWNWLKANWPLLVAILAGPIGVATLLIIRHWTEIKAITLAVWTWIKGFITATLNAIRSVIATVLGAIKTAIVAYFNFYRALILAVWTAVRNGTVVVWRFLAGFIRATLAAIRSVIASAFGAIRAIISAAMAGVKNTIINGFNVVKGVVTRGAAAVLATMRNMASGFLRAGRDAINNLKSGIETAMRSIGSWVKGHIVDPIVNAVKHFFGIHSPSTVMAGIGGHLVQGLFNGMVPGISGIGNMVHQVFGSFPGALATMVSHGLISFASLPGKALNAIMGLFGSGGAGGLAMTARKYLGHRYVWGGGANAQTGFDCSSFVNMLGGMLNLTLPGGFRAPSAQHGPATGSWLSTAMQRVAYGMMRPNDLYVSPEHMGVVTGMNTGFAARSTATGTGPQTIGGGYSILRFPGGKDNKLPGWLQGALGHISGLFAKMFGGGPSGGEGDIGGVSAGAQRWTGLMRQVLGMFHRQYLLSTFMRQLSSESGGNPNAVNNWDSNARAGIPSQGLMQVIPPTFAQYAGRYRGLGIRNPFANIYAAVAYALQRYGSNVANVLGHGHGYASGGVISEPVTGIGHRSGHAYFLGERGPELVSPLTGRGAGVPGSGGRAITINVYPQPGQSETEIAAAVSRRLAWAVSTGRA